MVATSQLLADLIAAQPTIVRQILTLVSCESPSADQSAVARSAAAVAAIGTEVLGVAPEIITVDGCTHVAWHLGQQPSRLMLLCHHDTVWPLGSLDQIPAGVLDGVLRGPGCFDMKTGIVMAFHAAAHARTSDGLVIVVPGE